MAQRQRHYVRQMPKMYGNLHKPKKDWSGWWRTLKKIVLYTLGLAAVYVIFFGPVFRVRKVEVQGAEISDNDQLISAVPLGSSLWFLPKQTILQNIAAKNPAVTNVSILRGIPDSVRLVVTERQPELSWVSTGKTYLIDSRGIPFSDVTTLAADPNSALSKKLTSLPKVIDTQNIPVTVGTQSLGLTFVDFTGALPALLQQYLPSVQIDHAEVAVTTYDLTVFMKSGMQVIFNTLGDAGVQVRNLTRLVTQNDANIATSHVDLRIDRWAYVR